MDWKVVSESNGTHDGQWRKQPFEPALRTKRSSSTVNESTDNISERGTNSGNYVDRGNEAFIVGI